MPLGQPAPPVPLFQEDQVWENSDGTPILEPPRRFLDTKYQQLIEDYDEKQDRIKKAQRLP